MKNSTRGFAAIGVVIIVLIVLVAVGEFYVWSQHIAQPGLTLDGTSAPALTATPLTGDAPLSVTFSSLYGGPAGIPEGEDIDFGDGSPQQGVRCENAGGMRKDICVTPAKITHTYSTAGTYTATLNEFTVPICPTSGSPIGCPTKNIHVDGTVVITIAGAAAVHPTQNAATIDQNGNIFTSNNPTISGTVSGQGPFTVSIYGIEKDGGRAINVVPIVNGRWSVVLNASAFPPINSGLYNSVGTLPNGDYRIQISQGSTAIPGTALATAQITVNAQSSPVTVSSMSKYTDSDFGFSFWYPTGWTVASVSVPDSQKHIGEYETVHGRLVVSSAISGHSVTLDEITTIDTSIGVGNPAKSGVNENYSFDANTHTWMYSTTQTQPSTPVVVAADVSHNTIGGLHIFTGLGTFGENHAVPLSAKHFVVSQVSGELDPTPLVNTIVATDPTVATSVSADEQTKIIQAEKDAYAGQ